MADLNKLEKDFKHLQRIFMEWQERLINYKMKEKEEKELYEHDKDCLDYDGKECVCEETPSWNLADVGAETFKQVTDIKTFIQKVKEDVYKGIVNIELFEEYTKFEEILDKNAGDL